MFCAFDKHMNTSDRVLSISSLVRLCLLSAHCVVSRLTRGMPSAPSYEVIFSRVGSETESRRCGAEMGSPPGY